jgi:hypothetical protein
MGVDRIAYGVSVVSDSECYSVRVDGEDLARKVYRRAKYSIKSEGKERKIKKVIKKIGSLYIIIYLKENSHKKI